MPHVEVSLGRHLTLKCSPEHSMAATHHSSTGWVKMRSSNFIVWYVTYCIMIFGIFYNVMVIMKLQSEWRDEHTGLSSKRVEAHLDPSVTSHFLNPATLFLWLNLFTFLFLFLNNVQQSIRTCASSLHRRKGDLHA